jgi:hypothetical protein
MTIKIYTLSDKRPDFINLQYETIKKHVTDDFEYIVINNAVDSAERTAEIDSICESLGVESLKVILDPSMRVSHGEVNFTGDQYANANLACSYPTQWAWINYMTKHDDLVVNIDSDMFLIKNVSFKEMIGSNNFGIVHAYRGNDHRVHYPWNGFFIADIPNMPNPEEMDWGCGEVLGERVDVGGQGHYYLKKYQDQLKTLNIEQWGVLDDRGDDIEVSVNGCAQFFINLEEMSIDVKNRQASDHNTFDHQSPRDNYWDYFSDNFIDIINETKKTGFPKPTFVDFLKLEKDDTIKESFIFHYKAGSNYMAWANSVYNSKKTEAFTKLLSEGVFND